MSRWAWRGTQCLSCGTRGLLPGEDGMEMVSFPNGYAHYKCAVLGWAARGIPCPGCQRVPCDRSSGACLPVSVVPASPQSGATREGAGGGAGRDAV